MVDAFLTPSSSRITIGVGGDIFSRTSQTPFSTELAAKKKKKKRSNDGSPAAASVSGFGKVATTEPPPAPSSGGDSIADDASPVGLRSIESTEEDVAAQQLQPSQQLNLDPNLSPEEKSQAILRQKFGLKSFDEQQSNKDAGVAEAEAAKKAALRNKLRNLDSVWPENADVWDVIPTPILVGFGNFLKLGLGICTVAFVAAGFAIAAEAWSVASKNPLPENIDNFIVNIVEPNFTPGLLVLLGFSVSLGLFASAQLGSKSSVYREEP